MKKTIVAAALLMATAAEAKPIANPADQIVSVFEYSTTQVQYCAIEDIHDGRGYTAGSVGFTSATGDLYELILRYRKLIPQSEFSDLEPILKQRAQNEDASVVGLERLPQIWKKVCNTRALKNAQDQLVDDFYKKPARLNLKKYHFKSRLAFLIFFDTMVQHGNGNDPDSFSGVIAKMRSIPESESDFLKEFLKARIKILNHASNVETREVWKESVVRGWALLRLVEENQFNLKTPLTLRVWDHDFIIK